MTRNTASNLHGAADAVVVARELRFGYGTATVIDGFSAALRAGKLTVLIGPNAAGKSTLLKLMLGHLSPWSGQCAVAGRPVTRLSASERAAWLSFVPQHGQSAFAFTVEEVVAMGRFALRRDEAAIESALQRCDLLAHRRRIFGELSAGQQQRVLLARALAQSSGDGRAMLLDEPVSSMDLHHVDATMRLLAEQARQGLAVLAVLHDLNLAARWADDLWLMHHGRLAAAGSAAEIMQSSILEPVYQVKLRDVAAAGEARPVLVVDGPGHPA